MAGNRRWTVNEIENLKQFYGKISMIELSNNLNRSIDSLHKKASDLGYSYEDENYSPSIIPQLLKRVSILESKIRVLEELILKVGKDNVKTKTVKTKTVKTKTLKTRKNLPKEQSILKLRINESEILNLINEGAAMTDIAFKFRVTLPTVKDFLLRLNTEGKIIKDFRVRKKISYEDNQFLIENYNKLTREELSKLLNVNNLTLNSRIATLRRKGIIPSI